MCVDYAVHITSLCMQSYSHHCTLWWNSAVVPCGARQLGSESREFADAYLIELTHFCVYHPIICWYLLMQMKTVCVYRNATLMFTLLTWSRLFPDREAYSLLVCWRLLKVLGLKKLVHCNRKQSFLKLSLALLFNLHCTRNTQVPDDSAHWMLLFCLH